MKEMTDGLDDLAEDEREKFKEVIGDLLVNTPKTELAVHRYKNVIRKVSSGSANVLKEMIMNLASEAVKKMILGNGG